MNKRLASKVALVTGAGTGIGRAIAQRFANEGANVLIVGRNEDTLKETTSKDSKISYLVADIEYSDNIERIFSEIKQRFGKLDVLVNNAGWAPVTPFSKVEMSEYDKVFGVNVRGLVDLTKQVLPLLKEAKGSIINLSSAITKNALPNMSLYAATKAAVDILTRVWAKELAKDGIRVNSIGVGPIETPIYGKTELSGTIILDLMLPGLNGMEVCRKIRQNDKQTPIMMLTARSEEIDKVMGLETGADDYLTKPFSIREFIARVKVIFRRQEDSETPHKSVQASSIISYGGLTIDLDKRKTTLNDERIDLSPKEFELIALMAASPGKSYSRKQLLNLVWGYEFEGYEHTVNSHINRLRGKIEQDVSNPQFILTTWGIGYRFNEEL